MQLRAHIAAPVFLASYLPLSIILLIQDLDLEMVRQPLCLPSVSVARLCELPLHNPALAIAFALVCASCLIVSLSTLRFLKPKQQIKIVNSKHLSADLMNYSFPYVVSFAGLTFDEPAKLLGFGVFFGWVFLITLQAGHVIMNPVLTVFGWRLYEVGYSFQGGTGEVHTAMALSRQELAPGEVHAQQSLQNIIIIK